MSHETAILIVAAGRGTRAGGVVPKQFALLGGVPVIARAVDAFGDLPVFVVIGDGQRAMLDAALGKRHVAGVAIGGATRQESVRNGLAMVADAGVARVLVHDAARPFVPRAVLDALLAALERAPGAIPVLPVADSLVHSDGTTVSRDDLWRVQTPQAFHLAPLRAALASWRGDAATDEAQVMRAIGHDVTNVPGDAMLDKLTHPEDFLRAEAMLAAKVDMHLVSRSASGFDVHRLERGEQLWLGGVHIAHSHGLSGHSDADVALHAITDALLGTIGAGDIGSHFPPSDPQWRGAASHRFVEHARDLITARGGRIDFVDLTIICEAPKIGPHREAMRTRIAAMLRLNRDRIGVKATTTERLGFTGRGEGIAAQAIATVRVPDESFSDG